MLEEYSSKDDYIKKERPISSIKIIDIHDITPVKSRISFFQPSYYFQIAFTEGIKYYYTKYEEYRDE